MTRTADRHLSIQTRRRWPPSICADRKRRPAVVLPPKLAMASSWTDGWTRQHFSDGCVILLLAVPPSVRPSFRRTHLIYRCHVDRLSATHGSVGTRFRLIPVSGTTATADVVSGQESTQWRETASTSLQQTLESIVKPATSQFQIKNRTYCECTQQDNRQRREKHNCRIRLVRELCRFDLNCMSAVLSLGSTGFKRAREPRHCC